MVNSLTQFQNQFGSKLVGTMGIIFILIGLLALSAREFIISILLGGFGGFILWIAIHFGRKWAKE